MSFSARHLGIVTLTSVLALGVSQSTRADDAPAPVAPPAMAAPAVPGPAAAAAPAAKQLTVTLPASALDDEIKSYIGQHPEVVMQALQAAQAKQQQAQTADASKAIGTESDKIYNDPNTPVAGNPDGKETLVEFYDYTCHYCKQLHPDVLALVQQDPNLKVIFKQFPILGPGGVEGAKAVLAAKKQGKFAEMDKALFDAKTPIDDSNLKAISDAAGTDYDKLKADMESPDVLKEISDTNALAQTLNIHGTPGLIINKQFYSGAMPLDQLKQKLQDNSKG